MTDLEKYIELYRSFGVEISPTREYCGGDSWKEGDGIWFVNLGSIDTYDQTLYVEPKLNHGYKGFYSVVHFDQDGKFIKQSFWE